MPLMRGVMCVKLQKTIVITLMLSSVGTAFCQSVEELEKKHLASIATHEGKAYESVAAAEFSSDLSFMPKCARRAGVNTGAVTIYYEVTSEGEVGNLYMTPNSVLVECIHAHIIFRKFTPPPKTWVGKITLTISQ